MGYTHVTVSVSNLQRSMPAYRASFSVDTGALVCRAPGVELRKAGIEPEGREACELTNGTPVEYEYRFARISFMGSDTVPVDRQNLTNGEGWGSLSRLQRLRSARLVLTKSLPIAGVSQCPSQNATFRRLR